MVKYKGVSGEYFCGNKVSLNGLKEGYVDYETFAKTFDHVLCNEAAERYAFQWEQVSGSMYYEDGYEKQVFQYFLMGEDGKDMVTDFTEDPVWYWEDMNLYVWGVTHYGTAWSCVMTDIKINTGEEAYKT